MICDAEIDTCSICLEDIENPNIYKKLDTIQNIKKWWNGNLTKFKPYPKITLECKHSFHVECLLGWTFSQNAVICSCPQCRRKIIRNEPYNNRLKMDEKLEDLRLKGFAMKKEIKETKEEVKYYKKHYETVEGKLKICSTELIRIDKANKEFQKLAQRVLSDLSIAQLKELAKKKGIKLSLKLSKNGIIAAIIKSRL